MKMIKLTVSAAILGALVALVQPASATVGIKIVAGASCAAAPATVPITTAGGTVPLSLCVTTTASERVCGATYPLKSTNAAANAAAIQVFSRTAIAPYTNVQDLTLPPVTLTSVATQFAQSVPPAGVQAGDTSTNIKIADLTFTIPSGLPSGTSFTFDVDATGEVATITGTNDCNDLNATAVSNLPNSTPLTLVTPLAPPSVSIAASAATLTDSAGQVSTITITASNSNPLTVNLTPPAVSGRYSTTCGSTIAVTNSATCTITAIANTTPFDGNVSALVTVTAGTGYTVGAPATATVAINNDDLPTATLSPATANVNDNGTSQTVTVTLNAAAPAGGFSVPITGPAANSRYSGTCVGATSIFVAAGATTGSCTIIGTANVVAGDGNVIAVVALNCGTACTQVAPASSTITIVDDDVPVITATCTPTTLTDSAGQVANCTISSDKTIGATPLSVTVTPPVVNALRYTLSNCTSPVVIPANTAAGVAVAACTITAVANTTLGDGNVTATFAVAAGSGYSVGGVAQNVAVNNDDLATINVTVSAPVLENSGNLLTYTFTPSAPSPTATTLLITPPPGSGRYSTTCASPLTLAANAVSVSCTVTPTPNTFVDGNVSVPVTLLPSAGNYIVGTATATGVITDDDFAITVAPASGAVTEGQNAVFTISCNGATGSYTANYTITGRDAGSVITPPATATSVPLNCTTGTSTATVTVSTIDDSIIGNARSVTLTVNSIAPAGGVAVGTPATATVTVLDNDQPLIVQPVIVPTMSAVGLGMLAMLIFGFAAFGQRRRVK